MATPGMCKAMGILALLMLGYLIVTVALPTVLAASFGGPIVGLVVGLAAGLVLTHNSSSKGDKRVVCGSSCASGFCGGLVSLKIGGALGAAAGALTTLLSLIVLFFVLSKLIWKV